MTGISVATTSVAIGTSKHGWFHKNAVLTKPEEVVRPTVPYNLSLKTRIILQGVDLDGEGALEGSLELLFKDTFVEQMTELLEKSGIALVSDRGLDGEVFIEVSDRMEDLGLRYLPFVTAVRWTEKKIGKMRITFTNSEGKTVSSRLQEENVYVQTGLFADSELSHSKQAVFFIPRVEYTLKGDTVALDKLNEQLFYRCIHRIQQKVNLDEFFGTPAEVSTDTQPANFEEDIVEKIVNEAPSKQTPTN